ncbi:hypothetical protein ScPMuIL_005494 [Solemya velum]
MAGKRVGILVEFNYEEMEVWYPFYRLKEEGYETFTIGPQKDMVYKSKWGLPCKSEETVDNVKAESSQYCSGSAPDLWSRDLEFESSGILVFSLGRPVASICHGPWVLCSAKLLKGKRATCFIAIKDDVENAGALYEDASVVVDGNLITSRKPPDLPDFCKALIAKLKEGE